ncbi:MAG: DUF1570 domain-containing protein [Aeoliella sp.]
MNRLISLALFGFMVCFLVVPASGAEFMFRATVESETYEGKPLHWTQSQMVLLARDGQLHYFDPRKAKDAKKTSPQFVGYSPSETRAALRREFGDGYSVDSTGHYLVVYPPGRGDVWGQRFEQLYRSFHGYFRVRGFELHTAEFPLVAVVFPSRDVYYRHARQSGVVLSPGTLGHYDPQTNRVLMYDPTAGQSEGNWEEAAATIVHEATHQTAYNVGLHSRTAVAPRWLVEGLAMMFEAPGVYRSEAFADRSHRINRERLDDFRTFLKRQGGEFSLAEFIASDQPFRTDGVRAYADAWALSFFLSETRPREYEQYLALTARRPPLAVYPPAERVADFRHCFAGDLEILAANFLQWTSELR